MSGALIMAGEAGTAEAAADAGQATSTAGGITLLSAANAPIELVFGLVGPTGVDLGVVATVLESQLKTVKYEARNISRTYAKETLYSSIN